MLLRGRRVAIGLTALVAAALGAADGIAVGTVHHHATAAAAPTARLSAALPAPAPTTVASPPPPILQVPASTLLASPMGTIPTASAPGATPSGSVGTWYGYQLALPVIAQRDGWSEVRLPQRPNGSTTWVPSSQVTFSQTPYFIMVSLSAMHLTVYRDGRPVMRFPAGIGLPATPTVTGQYFVAVHEPKADPVLGPVVLDLSAHSDAIQSWEGAGDAIIAIHGPVDATADAEIGSTGARVSNGCIRLHVADQEQLSVIPAGTPVNIAP